jgi:hypothetical protein
MKKITKKILLKREKRRIKKENKVKLIEWRKAVLSRDNYCCAVSKKQFGNHGIHIHHILPNTKKYEEFKYDVNNGIALSTFYHKFGPDAAHTNCLFLSEWLRQFRPNQYNYLITKLKEKNPELMIIG